METTTYNDLIELVSIPAGRFLMGSPSNEPGRYSDEGPQHEVTLEAFFLSRTPITQAKWRMVASWPMVERELNPDPSHFKGPDRPVEQVSWYDAMEFCARLSQRTGRTYTLPSEAQWEYACRAGTTTPFAFGETLTPEMAHFDTGGTSPVGSYPANAWGLHDMHGNVWEWCLDDWHGSYDGAPTDGRPWLEGDSLGKLSGAALGTAFPSAVARPTAADTTRSTTTATSASVSASGDDSLGKCSEVALGTRAIPGTVARPTASGATRTTATTPTSASVSASASGDDGLGKSSGAAVVMTAPGAAARHSAIATVPSFPTTSSDFAWPVSTYKPVRGGSWVSGPRNCRSAIRSSITPKDVVISIGFRVACLPQGRSA